MNKRKKTETQKDCLNGLLPIFNFFLVEHLRKIYLSLYFINVEGATKFEIATSGVTVQGRGHQSPMRN
jgi:hypothetical protein